MAGLPQIRGLLLEEVVLFFLSANGYDPIDRAGVDPTLLDGPSGIQVRGRGSVHQIDAIANYRFTPPFSHPYRLLVEAKSIGHPVGLGVIRNALGVLRDVCEYWASRAQPRYHYQYAVFTDTTFTAPAQDFGHVQDIFLLPLQNAASMATVIRELRAIREHDVQAFGRGRERLGALRRAFRDSLRQGQAAHDGLEFAEPLIAAAQTIGQALIGMALTGLPLFLVPEPGINLTALPDVTRVRIMWDDRSWYLRTEDGAPLFSFDLPELLFERYATQGDLTEPAALDLKEQTLSEIQATVFFGQQARFVRFVLDAEWVARVRGRIAERGVRRERR